MSWSHFLILIPLKSEDARLFYARTAAGESRWSKRELRNQIERKAFERSEIADTRLALAEVDHLGGNFKDPYFFDFLGLKEGYLENELENALLRELELFILELGKGFAFVERQKRMIIDGEDFYLDLLLPFFAFFAVKKLCNRKEREKEGQKKIRALSTRRCSNRSGRGCASTSGNCSHKRRGQHSH
ncbi:PDDEXK nuclease domain-containing protein [Desulforhopalus vacuolatus]|uniref:PDDEXK nuclease domain-containing protein n=1 Tax=Desulforhopalus vacuolatus TaxID=40414 RepID=UPI0034DF7F78